VTCPVGGGTFNFTLIIKRSLVNQENALSIVCNNSGASTTKDLETVFEPRNFWQWCTRELYNKLGLYWKNYKRI